MGIKVKGDCPAEIRKQAVSKLETLSPKKLNKLMVMAISANFIAEKGKKGTWRVVSKA